MDAKEPPIVQNSRRGPRQPRCRRLRETYRMGRRADLERIFEAQRAGVRGPLTGTGRRPETADRWLDAWVLEANRESAVVDALGRLPPSLRVDAIRRRGQGFGAYQISRLTATLGAESFIEV